MDKDYSNTKDDSNTSVLAVDDEYDIANLIKQSLENVGQRVCPFTDALSALHHFNSSNPNDFHPLVISDIRMPGMNGYELVKHIKKIDPKVKVVLTSAFEIEDKEFHNVLPDIKVDGFLQKPFSIRQLYDMTHKIDIRV